LIVGELGDIYFPKRAHCSSVNERRARVVIATVVFVVLLA